MVWNYKAGDENSSIENIEMIIILITIISSLLSIAFFTIAERKVMASMQRRRGPNVIGFWGSLQAFSDGLKLLLKEIIIPIKSN